MFRLVVVFGLVAIVAGQQQYHQNPKQAAIISEQRYQSGDGQFGAAYTQEDGTDFKEETDADGTRHGSYSYIDPTGQKRTVSYTAGKNGFQASGDHLPQAPPAPPQHAPQPQYQQQPQYRQNQPQAYQPQQQSNNYDAGNAADYDDGSYDPRFNDPSFSQGGNKQRFSAPAPVQQHFQQQQAAPIRPQQQQQPQYIQQQHQQQQQYQPQPQQQQHYTTDNPSRFQPPGKLSLNRTPDGFSYSFNKV